VLLLDQDTGRVHAIVEASTANAYRTAAADALAVQTLSRDDAKVLTIIGTGGQARHEARAVARVRDLDLILVVGRRSAAAKETAVDLREQTGLAVEVAEAEAGCRRADIVITATTAREPLFDANWIAAGTHVSAMGADGPGKQELPVALYERSGLFCDLEAQSRTLGEFQHAPGTIPLTPLGDVLHGRSPGRVDDAQITVFDSSGFALQDLTLAVALLTADNTHNRRPTS
jgi:ornithine cyclodeaminase/alanine dehydrogenase-like protein (mu-crystallin family)